MALENVSHFIASPAFLSYSPILKQALVAKHFAYSPKKTPELSGCLFLFLSRNKKRTHATKNGSGLERCRFPFYVTSLCMRILLHHFKCLLSSKKKLNSKNRNALWYTKNVQWWGQKEGQ
jgi:hypothetical protein